MEREKPEYGDVQDAIKLAQSFPNVSFIFGHAGLFQWPELRRAISTLKNVWLDGSL